MIQTLITPIHFITSFIDEMMHLSISQWDVEQIEEWGSERQQR